MLMVEQSPFLQHLRPQLYRDPFPPFLGSLALSERVRPGPEMKRTTKGRKVLWLGGIL